MKVVLSHRDLGPEGLGGGISRLYYELGRHLALLGCEVTYLSANPDFRCPWAKTVHIPYAAGEYAKYTQDIADFLGDYEFDIYECNVWRAEGLEYCRVPKHRPVVVRGDLCSKQFGDDIEAMRERELVKLADLSVAVSHAVGIYFQNHYGAQIPIVIWNGVNLDDFPFTQRRRSKPHLLWIGRPTAMKGFDRLEGMANAMPDAHFDVVLGRSLERVQLQNDHGNVTIHRNLPQARLEALFASSTFLLSTSRFEGFGLAVLEGMASGLVPLVPADIGGALDFVVHERNGLVYEDVSQLANGLALSDHQVAELSQAARLTAESLTWRRCAMETLAYYRTLAS